MAMKLTANITLHLILSSNLETIRTIFKLKAVITPKTTNNVENTPNMPFLEIYLGAS